MKPAAAMRSPLPPRKSRGMAVITVLVVMTVLSILAGALAIFMKVETQLAINSNDSEQLLWIGRAGAERACWILAQEPPGPTSLQQIWAGGPGVGMETNSPLAGVSLNDFPVGDGFVTLSMTEQESKFNVNTADAALIQQILTTMGVDAADISIVSDSILDWIDPDDDTRPAGAESDFYQGLTPPYNAKNAPIDDLQELQLVKGITPEMFNGPSQDEGGQTFERHRLGFGTAPGQTPAYPFGLRDVFTPWSNGKVNLNTASSNVIMCIPGMDAASAEGIINLRTSAGGGMIADGVLRDFNQLTPALSGPGAIAQLQRYCSFVGSVYEVHITARIGPSQREYVAIVFRNGRNSTIVGFHPK